MKIFSYCLIFRKAVCFATKRKVDKNIAFFLNFFISVASVYCVIMDFHHVNASSIYITCLLFCKWYVYLRTIATQQCRYNILLIIQMKKGNDNTSKFLDPTNKNLWYFLVCHPENATVTLYLIEVYWDQIHTWGVLVAIAI